MDRANSIKTLLRHKSHFESGAKNANSNKPMANPFTNLFQTNLVNIRK